MATELKLLLGSDRGTPIFAVQSNDPVFKKCLGAKYNAPRKLWTFPAYRPTHNKVLEEVTTVYPTIVVSDKVKAHIASLDKAEELPEDFKFVTKPFEHQKEGLLHLLNHPRAGLFFDPGLGKTKICVDYLRLLQKPALVLAPKVTLYGWQEELSLHGHAAPCTVISGTKKAKLKKLADAAKIPDGVVVSTLDTAKRYVEEFKALPYEVIIVDESHQLKSPFSERTKAAMQLGAKASNRIILSGTPSLGSPIDLYGQLRFLGIHFCPENWWAFKKLVCKFPAWEIAQGQARTIVGFKNIELMNQRVTRVAVRKRKSECLDLPARYIVDHKFDLGAKEKTFYNRIITKGADKEGENYLRILNNNALDHAQGAVLEPHVMCEEPVTQVGRLVQAASGFVYKTTKNPRLCDNCPNVQSCVENKISPYTAECKVASADTAPNITHNLVKQPARLEALEGILETILENPENKVIVWANYHKELDDIEALCKKLKISFSSVRGGRSAEELAALRKQFNEDPECRAYIGQVQTGIGITLNAANYMVYYSLPFSLDHYTQSLDRNHRVNQTREVTVYRLIARNTLDETKADALSAKEDIASLLTSSAPCVGCEKFSECRENGVAIYSGKCKYDHTFPRTKMSLTVVK